MNSILVMIGLAILFVGLAFAGLALKSFFRKDATLTTCSGGACACNTGENGKGCNADAPTEGGLG
jgi:hypothetical protein